MVGQQGGISGRSMGWDWNQGGEKQLVATKTWLVAMGRERRIEGGVQTVILPPPQVGQGYPHDPPKVKCETMVYHPNIDLEGNVCLNILRWDTGVVEVVVAVPSGAESHFGPTYPSGWNGV